MMVVLLSTRQVCLCVKKTQIGFWIKFIIYYVCTYLEYLTENRLSYDDQPDLEIINNVICKISDKWWNIGESLGLSRNELDSFRMLPNDTSLQSVLDRWMDTRKTPYTWRTIVTVLRSKEVDKKDVADDIEGKFMSKSPDENARINIQFCKYMYVVIAYP